MLEYYLRFEGIVEKLRFCLSKCMQHNAANANAEEAIA